MEKGKFRGSAQNSENCGP